MERDNFKPGGWIKPDKIAFKVNKGESVIPTGQEILYFNRMKAMKIFRPKNARSKFRILLDEEITLKLHDN